MSDEILNAQEQHVPAEESVIPAPKEPQVPAYTYQMPQAVAAEPQPVYQTQPVYQPQPVWQTQPEKAPKKHKMPLGVRILLRVLTVLLCVVLTVSLTATIVLLDANALVSRATIENVAKELLHTPAEEATEETESLAVELIYDAVNNGEQAQISKESVAEFVNDNAILAYLIDKTASYVEDFVKGTNETEITTEEIEDLLDENEALMEDVFGVEMEDQVRSDILKYVKENDLNAVVQEQLLDEIEKIPIVDESFTVGDLMGYIRLLFSPLIVLLLIGVDLLLAVAIFFTKRLRLGGTMLTVGSHVLSVGLLGSLPIFIFQIFPGLMNIDGIGGMITRVLGVLVKAITPIHYTFLIIGAVLIIVGVVLKIVLRPKKAFA